jgi:hypothetical protein
MESPRRIARPGMEVWRALAAPGHPGTEARDRVAIRAAAGACRPSTCAPTPSRSRAKYLSKGVEFLHTVAFFV